MIQGYIVINFNHKYHKAHRLVWLWYYGEIPTCQVDHINRIRNDNRIENLRLAINNHADNQQNRKRQHNNTSGRPGIHWHKKVNKWEARLGINRKRFFLGYFDNIEEASQAYILAKAKYHEFNPVTREEGASEL